MNGMPDHQQCLKRDHQLIVFNEISSKYQDFLRSHVDLLSSWYVSAEEPPRIGLLPVFPNGSEWEIGHSARLQRQLLMHRHLLRN
jgi:hypothetical protein